MPAPHGSGSVLRHALSEHAKAPVQALTFSATLWKKRWICWLAWPASSARPPADLLVSGRSDPTALRAFRLLALRSGGQYFEFDAETTQAIDRLAGQLNAVARFAVTGDASVLAIAANVMK